ncbi:MAG TPA: RNA polymerase sigma factor [Polyangia bacterium]|nr:RNA polymerase sigma factor [Polyangia bacterium]
MPQRSVIPQERRQQLPEVGPPPSFPRLFDDYFVFVWRTARRLGIPHSSLDDVVQETFMVAYRRRDDFEGRSSVKTWLYGIAFNVVRAHRRELGAKYPAALHEEHRADPGLLADGADGPHESAAKREAARFVDRFLERLNQDQRDVFVLAELEQLSAPEIATVLGAPLNTIYSRLRLARAEFGKAVARHRARDERRSS